MPNWKQLESDIFDYVDGLLPIEKRKRIDEQLKNNHAAHEFFHDIKNLRTSLKNLTPMKTSPDFGTVLRTRIRLEKSFSRRAFWGWPAGIPIAVAIGTLALLVYFLAPNNKGQIHIAASQKSDFSTSTLSRGESSIYYTNPNVNYPMDLVHVSQGGTPINSQSRKERSTRLDSAITSPRDGQLIKLEF